MSMPPVDVQSRQISRIDLTPLMDLTFILLITFIITFPLIEQGIPMNLPQAGAEALEDDQARTISLDREGALYLDGGLISREDLIRDMQVLGSVDPNALVLLRADEALPYGRVIEILKVLTDAKITRMALVTLPDA